MIYLVNRQKSRINNYGNHNSFNQLQIDVKRLSLEINQLRFALTEVINLLNNLNAGIVVPSSNTPEPILPQPEPPIEETKIKNIEVNRDFYTLITGKLWLLN